MLAKDSPSSNMKYINLVFYGVSLIIIAQVPKVQNCTSKGALDLTMFLTRQKIHNPFKHDVKLFKSKDQPQSLNGNIESP